VIAFFPIKKKRDRNFPVKKKAIAFFPIKKKRDRTLKLEAFFYKVLASS
jgi:hypothetical protein